MSGSLNFNQRIGTLQKGFSQVAVKTILLKSGIPKPGCRYRLSTATKIQSCRYYVDNPGEIQPERELDSDCLS